MEMKKRILSVAVLLTVLGAGLGYVSKHPYFSEKESVEAEDWTFEDLVKENEYNANPYNVYNEALKSCGVQLDENDISYLSSLRDRQDLVALSSTIGHYNIVSLNGDDAFVVMEEGKKPRVAEKELVDDYYYDILTGIYVSEGMYGIDPEDAIPLGEFVEKYDLVPEGYCVPNVGRCPVSEEALKTIEEIYGKELADLVREEGLPLPYYSYSDIYDVYKYDANPVKGLNN